MSDAPRVELVRFRVVERSERAWLYGLHVAAFRGYVERVYSAWDESSQRSRLEQVFEDHSSEVIVLGDVDVGVVYRRHEPAAVHIELFEVHPDFQGRGIGGLALRSMLERTEWPDYVRLSTGRENPARRLYDRMGFQVEREDDRRLHLLRVRIRS